MSSKYVTYEYKILLYNGVLVLSIVLFMILCINIALVAIAPNWAMKLYLLTGVLGSLASTWLLFKAVLRLTEQRDLLVVVEWVVSYIFLLISIFPITLFIYLNLDWALIAEYGTMVLWVYYSVENMVLPIAFLLLVSFIFGILTIQLYKKSYVTYLCLHKKKEIYG